MKYLLCLLILEGLMIQQKTCQKGFRFNDDPIPRPLIPGSKWSRYYVIENIHVPDPQTNHRYFNRLYQNHSATDRFNAFIPHPRQQFHVRRTETPIMQPRRNYWISPHHQRSRVPGIPSRLHIPTNWGERLTGHNQKTPNSDLFSESTDYMQSNSQYRKGFSTMLSPHIKGSPTTNIKTTISRNMRMDTGQALNKDSSMMKANRAINNLLHRQDFASKIDNVSYFLKTGTEKNYISHRKDVDNVRQVKVHSKRNLSRRLANESNPSTIHKTTRRLNQPSELKQHSVIQFGRRIKPIKQRPNSKFLDALSPVCISRQKLTELINQNITSDGFNMNGKEELSENFYADQKENANPTGNSNSQSLEMKKDGLHNGWKILHMSNIINTSNINVDQESLNETGNSSDTYFSSYQNDIPQLNIVRDHPLMLANSDKKLHFTGQTNSKNNILSDSINKHNNSMASSYPLRIKNVNEYETEREINPLETTKRPRPTTKPTRSTIPQLKETIKANFKKHIQNSKVQLIPAYEVTPEKIYSKDTSNYLHLLSNVLKKSPNFHSNLFYSPIQHYYVTPLQFSPSSAVPVYLPIHPNQPSSHLRPQLSDSKHLFINPSNLLDHIDHLPGIPNPLVVSGFSLLNSQREVIKTKIPPNQNVPPATPYSPRSNLKYRAASSRSVLTSLTDNNSKVRSLKTRNPKNREHLNSHVKINSRGSHNQMYHFGLEGSYKPVINVIAARNKPSKKSNNTDNPTVNTSNSILALPYSESKKSINSTKETPGTLTFTINTNIKVPAYTPMVIHKFYVQSLKIKGFGNNTLKLVSPKSENSSEHSIPVNISISVLATIPALLNETYDQSLNTKELDNSKIKKEKFPTEANDEDSIPVKTLRHAPIPPTPIPMSLYEIYDHSLKIDDFINMTGELPSNNSKPIPVTIPEIYDRGQKVNVFDNIKIKSNQSKADTEYSNRVKIQRNESIPFSTCLNDTNHHSLEMKESQSSKLKLQLTKSEKPKNNSPFVIHNTLSYDDNKHFSPISNGYIYEDHMRFLVNNASPKINKTKFVISNNSSNGFNLPSNALNNENNVQFTIGNDTDNGNVKIVSSSISSKLNSTRIFFQNHSDTDIDEELSMGTEMKMLLLDVLRISEMVVGEENDSSEDSKYVLKKAAYKAVKDNTISETTEKDPTYLDMEMYQTLVDLFMEGKVKFEDAQLPYRSIRMKYINEPVKLSQRKIKRFEKPEGNTASELTVEDILSLTNSGEASKIYDKYTPFYAYKNPN